MKSMHINSIISHDTICCVFGGNSENIPGRSENLFCQMDFPSTNSQFKLQDTETLILVILEGADESEVLELISEIKQHRGRDECFSVVGKRYTTLIDELSKISHFLLYDERTFQQKESVNFVKTLFSLFEFSQMYIRLDYADIYSVFDDNNTANITWTKACGAEKYKDIPIQLNKLTKTEIYQESLVCITTNPQDSANDVLKLSDPWPEIMPKNINSMFCINHDDSFARNDEAVCIFIYS